MQAHYRGYGSVAGCYSPCLKLTDPKWNNSASRGRRRDDQVAAPFCCPTPPVSPQACRSGPVARTQYVQAVHKYCAKGWRGWEESSKWRWELFKTPVFGPKAWIFLQPRGAKKVLAT